MSDYEQTDTGPLFDHEESMSVTPPTEPTISAADVISTVDRSEIVIHPSEARGMKQLTDSELKGKSPQELAAEGETERLEIKDREIDLAIKVEGLYRDYVAHGIRQGQRLIAIKANCEHGEFIPLRDRVTGGKADRASRYMRMAMYKDHIGDCTSQNEAMKLIGQIVAKEERPKTCEDNASSQISHMRYLDSPQKDGVHQANTKRLASITEATIQTPPLKTVDADVKTPPTHASKPNPPAITEPQETPRKPLEETGLSVTERPAGTIQRPAAEPEQTITTQPANAMGNQGLSVVDQARRMPPNDQLALIQSLIDGDCGDEIRIALLDAVFAGLTKSTTPKALKTKLDALSKRLAEEKKQSRSATMDEVHAYAVELSESGKPKYIHAVECVEDCWDHYTGNGWVQGSRGKPLVCWKSAFRIWVRNQDSGKFGPPRPDKPKSLEEVREFANQCVKDGTRTDAPKYAAKFLANYESSGWMIRAGVPVRDWKQRFKIFCSQVGGDTTEDRVVEVTCTPASKPLWERKLEIAEEKAKGRSPASLRDVERFASILKMHEDYRQAENHVKEFHNFYTANGWKKGSNPIVDWGAAFKGWVLDSKSGKFSSKNEKPEYDPLKSFPILAE